MNTDKQSRPTVFSAESTDEDVLSMYRAQIMAGFDIEPREFKGTETRALLDRYTDADRPAQLEILAECFYRIDEDGVVDFLTERLDDEDQQTVVLAMMGLSEAGTEEAREAILDQIRSPSSAEILVPGINLLERIDPGPEAVEPLVDLLRHSWDEVKFHAAMALGRLDGLSVETLLKHLEECLENGADVETKYYVILLIKEGDIKDAVPLLENLLEDDEIGYFAMEALGLVGDDGDAEVLEQYLESDDPIRQYYAAEAVGNAGRDACWDQLVYLAQNHKDRNVRYYASRSLHQLDRERSIEILLDRLQDDDPEIRNFASQALVEFGDVVLKPYRTALDSDDREAVIEALQVLGEIGDNEVLGDLLEKVYSADKEIEHAAIEALQKMARDDEDCRQWLLSQLPESDPSVKINVLRVLEGLGNSELCSYLSRYTNADNTKLRYYTVGVCSNQDNPECLHLLERLCGDDNLQVATYAVRALTQVDSREARQMSVDLVKQEIRPLVLIAYMRGFYLHRSPQFEKAVVNVLEATDDRRVRYYAGAALKAINQHRLERMAEGDEYFQSILDRVRVT